MEKFSLFDLLSFALPGGASMVLLYWAANNTTDMRVSSIALPDVLLAVVLLMLAYFMGHIVNELGMKLEAKIGPMPKSWVEILAKNPELAQNLDEFSAKVFGTKFLNEDGTIDEHKSDVFYDRAFGVLEINGKLEKVKTLQSQYIFFRNMVALGLIGVLAFAVVFGAKFFKSYQITEPIVLFSLIGILVCILSMRVSRSLAIKRRKMKMHATLHNFYAFYISETKLKQH